MIHDNFLSLLVLLLTATTTLIGAPPIKAEPFPEDIGIPRDISTPRDIGCLRDPSPPRHIVIPGDISSLGESSSSGSGSATLLRHQPETEKPHHYPGDKWVSKEPDASPRDHNVHDQGKLAITTHTNQNEDQEAATCAICLDDLENDQHDKIKKWTTCTHLFHEDCIAEWTKEHKTCPICREVDHSLPEPRIEPPRIEPTPQQRRILHEARDELIRLEQLPPSDQNNEERTALILSVINMDSIEQVWEHLYPRNRAKMNMLAEVEYTNPLNSWIGWSIGKEWKDQVDQPQ
ncbi:hypothetical protein PSTG_08475 [Puccinia striiformis f. sp. tritici PST-78]|uniref:RING-type domain-containing protein n=1 Tax=Puccinia striiformis f. sp. tritici PST-78 TaxID=1165861 RepID=A0A0L0VFZ2_9BASI|nr:hypothetical protein PSTG_08475 [Puccinia striiformis f. sp. tritici PST-78]